MSSESGDDFESADEDFDFDQPSKSEEDNNQTPESSLEAKLVSRVEETECPVISRFEEKFDSLKLTEASNITDSPTEKHEASNITDPAMDEFRNSQKVAESHLTESKNDKLVKGTRIDPENEDIVLTKDSAIKSCQVEGSVGIKPKPATTKLGAKLTKEIKPAAPDGKTSENPQPEIKRINLPSESEIGDNQIAKYKETKDGHKSPEEPSKETSQGISAEGKLLDDKSDNGWGDGWEIEEEDGFEIPVSKHAKHIDSGIQSSEEHREIEQSVKFPRLNEQESQGWGGWGNWGVGSLISTATGSVSTFSSQVTAGLSTVIGAPDPQELAAAAVKRQKEVTDSHVQEDPSTAADDHSTPYVGLGSLVSGVSSLGSSVIYRGLDTLESLGKKTMEVIQEGDPGLKKKRALLFPTEDKPVLSKILREAKEKAEHSDKEKEEKAIARRVHFESLFDDYHGMVHLEALEMLSTQCVLKLQSMVAGEFGPGLQDLQETLTQVQDLCELPDDEEDQPVLSPDEFAEKVSKCIRGLNVTISSAKIIQTNNEVYGRLSSLCSGNEAPTVINQTAISSLAEFTAIAMESFHKSAELLLAKSIRNTPDEAENYIELTGHLCARVSAMAGEFTQLLTKNNPIANSALITNIFLEASNSCSYIKNACQLLVPILQVGAVAT